MAQGVLLLDGGLGQELIRRSPSPAHHQWSLQVMLKEPDLVAEVHRDFCDAGANIACLNTYAITRARLARPQRFRAERFRGEERQVAQFLPLGGDLVRSRARLRVGRDDQRGRAAESHCFVGNRRHHDPAVSRRFCVWPARLWRRGWHCSRFCGTGFVGQLFGWSEHFSGSPVRGW